ncbi:MAG TPA: DUF2303 family protein [Steroidobacteraceae bacterium]|jgi:uncharacterized protein YfdQ (DUF2303 family)|nr:DUF2303 family protein [Steroidobacteraceae bacterium]
MSYDDDDDGSNGDNPQTNAQAIINTVRELVNADVIHLADAPAVLVLPAGKTAQSVKPFLDAYLKAPERKTGTAQLSTLDSFCQHVNRFSDEDSALFADDNPTSPRLVGVLNYHESKAGSPRFGDHRASYTFPLSVEWLCWTRTRPMNQAQFAEFIEDHIADVLDPSKIGEDTWAFCEQLEIVLAQPSALMALSKGLSVYVDGKVTNNVNLADGTGSIAFSEEHKDAQGAPLKVPRGFAVGIPVFTGGERYALPMRLRYKVMGGKVTWELLPHRVQQAFRHAVTEACTKAAEATKLPLYYGTPET